ncbi:Taurine--pyruvate aminotransferase [Geobacillus sp. BCO2]|nr:Taurine--pyruvate aminotransferase [Geobacillus sp. BCO2]
MKTEQPHQLWLDKDDRYIWHSMKPYNPQATLIAAEAKGCWVTDAAGRQYLDAMAGLWCVNIGYGREELAEAAYEQLKTLAYFPLTQSHLPAIGLGEKLNELLGDEYVIFFSNSGSEANETAFKIARQYHQQRGEHHRYKMISRYRAYHGNSMGRSQPPGRRSGNTNTNRLRQGSSTCRRRMCTATRMRRTIRAGCGRSRPLMMS